MKEEFKRIIFESLNKAKLKNIDIYTLALYHDHESHFASVCIDTIESSSRSVIESNRFSREQFMDGIVKGDINSAMSWNSNSGRSFSLGDFALVNVSEVAVSRKPQPASFYIDMVHAIEEMKDLIQIQSSHGKDLFFCCSTENSEVGLIWS